MRHVLLNRASTDPSVRAATRARRSSELDGGRLLVYFPDASLFDGAAEAESRGFFDVDNVPPWDTWIGLFRDDAGDASFGDYLLSWVPGDVVAIVDRGIWANPEKCILWLADSRVPLAEAARLDGLLR